MNVPTRPTIDITRSSELGERAEVLLDDGELVVFSTRSLAVVWEDKSESELPADEDES